jgi:hypothetical protein
MDEKKRPRLEICRAMLVRLAASSKRPGARAREAAKEIIDHCRRSMSPADLRSLAVEIEQQLRQLPAMAPNHVPATHSWRLAVLQGALDALK